jgi:glycosyltransferase involved in cell wall biosynthesis
MRALFVTPYPPMRDGLGTYSEMLCGELLRQGHDVAVIGSRPVKGAPPIVIGDLPAPGRAPEAAIAAARALDPDVVHVQFAGAAFGARLRGLLALLDRMREDGRAVVATLHDVTRDLETLGPAARWVYRAIGARCDRVIVHTTPAAEAYARIAGSAAPARIVAHPTVELPASSISVQDLRERHGLGSDPVILSFGFIHVDKGIADLLLAVARLRDRGRLGRGRVVIAGEVRRRYGVLRPFEMRDRAYLRRLQRLISEHGLHDSVLFTGFVPAQEIRPWFDAATLAVLPYRRIEQSGAGSLARGAGVPLLATDVGELAELSTVPPVAPGDPAQLADALERALEGDLSRVAPDAAGDLGEIVGETVDVYRELLGAAEVVAR